MLDEVDKKVVRAIQEDFPLVPGPYGVMAASAGISEEEFLIRVNRLKAGGQIRRMGAVLQHHRAGFTANVLCAWQVPAEQLDAIGTAMSREPAISHCYSRRTAPGWPYNLYTMIHAQSRAECDAIAARLSAEHHITERRMLYSVREWKKSAMKYFCE